MRAENTPFNFGQTEGPLVLSTKRKALIEANRDAITRDVIQDALARFLAKGGVIQRIESPEGERYENPLLSTYDHEFTNRLSPLGDGTWMAPRNYDPTSGTRN